MKIARFLVTFGPLGVALMLFAQALHQVPGNGLRALFLPDDTLPHLLLHMTALPRFAAAVVAGAALAVAGALLQRVFANPLAEPGTIGVLAGAQTGLTALLLWAPGQAAVLRLPVGMAGGALAFGLVLVLAARQRMSALSLILSGMVVTMVLGGLNGMLALFHHDVLQSLFLWQAGALEQDGWGGVVLLSAVLGAVLVLSGPMERPLTVIETGDETARSLGLSPGRWRVVLSAIAILLSAASAATVGAVAFIGILAPSLLYRTGAARPALWRVGCAGAGLLSAADQLTGLLPARMGMHTGTVVALIGGLALLALLPALRSAPQDMAPEPAAGRAFPPVPRWLPLPVAALCLFLSLGVGRTPLGWELSLLPMLEWRLPRVVAAIAAGAAFGLAGAILQRLLGNRMAGPELLGISGAAALGLVIAVLTGAAGSRAELYGGSCAGALAGLVLITSLGARRRFGTRDLLLTGLGVTMLFSALLAGLLASGHPVAGLLLGWLSGSTYRVGLPDASLALIAVAALAPLAMFQHRWLDILPLGAEAARALGVDLRQARSGLVATAALATAVGTLLVGPLGLIGLLAPNIARHLALPRATRQIPAAMAVGAGVMLLADWLGRVLVFPWQIPAGLMAQLLGGVMLMVFLSRGRR